MQLEKDLWIEDGFYVDFDDLGQLRVIGPNNHLYCGLIDIPRHKIAVKSLNSPKDGRLVLKGEFLSSSLNLYYPAMDDIRTMRNLVAEGASFLEIRRRFYDQLVPQIVKTRKGLTNAIIFRRRYGDSFYYQSTFKFSPQVKIEKISKPFRGFQLKIRTKKIPFTLISQTNEINKHSFRNLFTTDYKNFDFRVFGRYQKIVRQILERTGVEIEHLLAWGKTSADRFGTIFPRDWMESADIGVHDLTPEARTHLYHESLKNVNEEGQAWHEDVVGEYKYEFEVSGRDIFDRHMIDIEPHYIIGLEQLPEDFLLEKEIREKLKRVANYIVKEAKKKYFIIFKKLPTDLQTKLQQYYATGNWRDSDWAYKKLSQQIAPFDVNAVFYPKALRVLKEYQGKLGLKIRGLDELIKKWDRKRNDYRFIDKKKLAGYALAFYGDRHNKTVIFRQMAVHHLDEAYLYTYEKGTPQEIASFCARLLDPNYFYTRSGPLLIARNNGLGYTTEEYHGLVTWTKQAAFTVLGLSKHLKIAITEEWPKPLQKQIKRTLLKICEDMISTFNKLGFVPEFHYDDNGTPRIPSVARGKISKIQLWSAVGARRVIRKYYELKTDERYKI